MYLFAVVSCKLSVSWALVIPCGYQNIQNTKPQPFIFVSTHSHVLLRCHHLRCDDNKADVLYCCLYVDKFEPFSIHVT